MRGWFFLIKCSYRNLGRAPKRTLIMLLSLIFGTAFILWDLNFASSGTNEMIKSFLSHYTGRYQVTAPGFYDKKDPQFFDVYKVIRPGEHPELNRVKNATRRVVAPVYLSGEMKSQGVLLTGLDVTVELKTSQLKDALFQGSFLNPNGNKEILLGKRLAKKLKVKMGDEVVALGQGLDGSVANDLFTVVGTLDFGGGDLEDTVAFTQFHSAQELMGMNPDQFHQLVSFDMDLKVLPQLQSLQVSPWDDLLPDVGASMQFMDSFTWIISCIIVLVISLGLANTLMITFFEREKEFQSLNIIGAKMTWITKSLIIEVLVLSLLGILVGSIIGHIATVLCGIYPVDLGLFTNGKPIIMGGMVVKPLIKFYPVLSFYWQVPLLILTILGMTMIYPLIKVVQKSRHF